MKYLLILALVIGCSVKDKPGTSPEPLTTAPQGNLPPNVQWTPGKSFLVHIGRDAATFVEGKMEATYSVVDASLQPPAEAKLAVFYHMPEMPEMPVVPAVVEQLAPGLFKVAYDISMPGVWKIILTFSGAGKEERVELPTFTVPE